MKDYLRTRLLIISHFRFAGHRVVLARLQHGLVGGYKLNLIETMARECPDCHTIVADDRLWRCGACGSILSSEKVVRRWEHSIVTYILIAVAIGLILAAVMYFHMLPGQ